MALLQISEYPTVTTGGLLREPALATQVIELGDESRCSAEFNRTTTVIRLYTDIDCAVRFGSDPVASASDTHLLADTVTIFPVNGGIKLAAVLVIPTVKTDITTAAGLLEVLTDPAKTKQWLAEFTKQCNEANAQITTANAKIQAVRKAERELAKHEADVQEWEGKILVREQKVTVREGELADWNARLRALEVRLTKVQEVVTARTTELESNIDKHRDEHQAKLAELEALQLARCAELDARNAVLDEREKALAAEEAKLKDAHEAARQAEAQHLSAVKRIKSVLSGEGAVN